MELTINGSKRKFNPDITTLTKLSEALNISLDNKIIELNNTIIKKESYSHITLQNFDNIEII